MKKYLINSLGILILIVLLFNITEVKVFDEALKTPISGVKVNNFLTNEQGIAKFLDLNFNQFLIFERIGYQATKLKIGIKPIYRVIQVNLTEGDLSYIKEQINIWASKVSKYKYELTNSETGYSYTFVQVINGEDKYTKTITNQNGQITEREIFVISGRVYTRENGRQIQEITENKEDFLADNLVIIPLVDVINEFLASVNEKVKYETPTKFIFSSSDSKNTLTLNLSNNGIPSEFTLENINGNKRETVNLKIDLDNVEVNLDEN
ncbi:MULTISPECIES: hypothetical protein [Caldisericum]|jgi:hypothetical protein|uniref:hypothetical protein n=1 Tax=Caldisericum TaxID=693074 RepID=UPI0039FD1907